MAFDYEAKANAVLNALTNANTTTASPDLSSGMTTRVKTIRIDDTEVVSVRSNELPAVFIKIDSAEEEASGLGPTGPGSPRARKFKEVSYNISGFYQKDGLRTRHTSLMTEVHRLAENIEGVFQKEYDLSTTALWSHPEETVFGEGNNDGTRIMAVTVTLRARYLFQ